MKKFLIVIPARSGSKGILNKNFETVGGIALVDRSILHARQMADIADICVSTDNIPFLESKLNFVPEEDQILRNEEGIFFHRRPKKLSQDESLIMDLLYHLVFSCKEFSKTLHESIVLLQPTSPFRSNSELNRVRGVLENEANSLFSLVTFRDAMDVHPARMYRQVNPSNFTILETFSEFSQRRRQDCPPLFLRDGGYYILGRDLVEHKIQAVSKTKGFIRDFPYSINIDSQEDLIIAEIMAKEITEDPNWRFSCENNR